MDFDINAVLYISICSIILYELYRAKPGITTVYIFTAICIVGLLITKDIYPTILLALLLTYILDTLIDSGSVQSEYMIEGMKNRRKAKNSKKLDKKSKELSHLMGDISGMLKDIKLNKKEAFEPYSKSKKYHIDKRETKRTLYNKMNKKQKSGLKKDTEELINTQKELINTMKEMGPVLSQGKNIMKTFDQYFGEKDKKNNDLSYIMDRMKTMNFS